MVRRARHGETELAHAAPEAPLTPRSPEAVALKLQRAHGNAAVARMLMRAPVTTDADTAFRDALASASWAAAADALQRFASDGEREAALRPVTLAQASGLELHLRKAGPPALHALALAQRDRIRDREYDMAVAAGDWPWTAKLLDAFDDGPLLVKARELLALGALARVQAAASPRVQRFLAYAAVEKQADKAGAAPGGHAMQPGAPAGPGVAVAGGTVTTYAGFADPASHTAGWFGFDYRGAEAERTGWLQFISMQAEKRDAHDGPLGFKTDMTTRATNQPDDRRWSDDKVKHWAIDSSGAAAPYYAAEPAGGKAFEHTTGPSQSAIWDLPGSSPTLIRACFDEDAHCHSVVITLTFADYLVRGMEVLYESPMVVTYVAHRDAPQSGPNPKPGAGRVASQLAPEHYVALVGRFPAWSFFPHG